MLRVRRSNESRKIIAFTHLACLSPDRYQERYGFWRPVVSKAVQEFLKCGDLREGFARVRCPECGHDLFVAFSCKQRGICPSCHQKRTLITAINVAENIAAPVPHRQFVWTMPKRFRLYFRYSRDLLRELPKLAWEATVEVYRAVLGRKDVVPGMVAAIQSFGSLMTWHPHIHCLTTYGAFTPEGTFIPLPDGLATEPFLMLWEGSRGEAETARECGSERSEWQAVPLAC